MATQSNDAIIPASMGEAARYLARFCWWWMLVLMRRPWMKRLQRGWISRYPPTKRDKAWNSFKRQNRFARRYGLKLLTISLNILFISFFVTMTFRVVVWLYESGFLEPLDIRR